MNVVWMTVINVFSKTRMFLVLQLNPGILIRIVG